MYLHKLLIEKCGPINKLKIDLPINENNPNPVIFVGLNGSGKTTVLGLIADALTEMAMQSYKDIVRHGDQFTRPYFRVIGFNNKRIDSEYSIAILRFINNNENLYYIEKTGKLEFQNYINQFKDEFPNLMSWTTEGNDKKVTKSESVYENEFKKGTYCYFPSERWEIPYWMNKDSIEIPEIQGKSKKYLNKPVYIQSSLDTNKNWIKSVLTDARIPLTLGKKNRNIIEFNNTEVENIEFWNSAKKNLENILGEILNTKVELQIPNRLHKNEISINIGGKTLIPSLDNLSSGQSILFNIFATIIRYSDMADLRKGSNLDDIHGIVLIDEIESNLHSDLCYSTLPKLIKLFPKIQFIISTHSPLFLVGMHEQFNDEMTIYELPDGKVIDIERFVEFKNSLEIYKKTELFEEEIKTKFSNIEKPIILTEGFTDKKYLLKAIQVLGYTDLGKKIQVDTIGIHDEEKEEFCGKDSLNKAKDVFKYNTGLLKQKVILLYDCDVNGKDENFGNLYTVFIKNNKENTKIKRGIENLLPGCLFTKEFYPSKKFFDEYSAEKTIEEFQKADFCKFVCDNKADAETFNNFKDVLDRIQKIIG